MHTRCEITFSPPQATTTFIFLQAMMFWLIWGILRKCSACMSLWHILSADNHPSRGCIRVDELLIHTLHSGQHPQERGKSTWALCPSSVLTPSLDPILLSTILQSPFILWSTPLCFISSSVFHSLLPTPLPSPFSLCISLHLLSSSSIRVASLPRTVSLMKVSVMQLKPGDWLGLAGCKVGKAKVAAATHRRAPLQHSVAD